MALLYHAANVSMHFSAFLIKCMPAGRGRIVLYIDETRPGNIIRPDNARAYNSIYWTLLEFPAWYRARDELGWIPFASIMTKDLQAAGTNVAEVMKVVMRIFWGPTDGDWNMEEPGMVVRHRGNPTRLRLTFAGFLGDAKSHAEVLSLKGSSGRMPCPNCLNCLG